MPENPLITALVFREVLKFGPAGDGRANLHNTTGPDPAVSSHHRFPYDCSLTDNGIIPYDRITDSRIIFNPASLSNDYTASEQNPFPYFRSFSQQHPPTFFIIEQSALPVRMHLPGQDIGMGLAISVKVAHVAPIILDGGAEERAAHLHQPGNSCLPKS